MVSLLRSDMHHRLIEAGKRQRRADLVINGGSVVNVMTGEVYKGDVAIVGAKIAAVGDVGGYLGPDTRKVDATGAFLVPGLIDGHIHSEVTKLSMTMFARLVLPCGTTSIVTAFDQIAGVAGLRGVRDFMKAAEAAQLKVHYGIPSKLPYTSPSSTLNKEFGPEQAKVAASWPQSVGIWETGPETILGSPDGGLPPDNKVLETIEVAADHGLQVYGSAPLLRGERLSAFVYSGMRSDHESYSSDEALEKLRSGLYVMIRESSIVRFLKENLRMIYESKVDARRVAFCTDDVTATDVLQGGHLDAMVRQAVELGVDPVTAIQMATINCAELYQIDDTVGSITPGRAGDILVVDDLKKFRVKTVFANGRKVASQGRFTGPAARFPKRSYLNNTVRVAPFGSMDFAVRIDPRRKRVKVISMRIESGSPFLRKRHVVSLDVNDGLVIADPDQDVVYAAVVERHKATGRIAVAFVNGFGIARGALASSVSPDDNNIICIGSSPDEMVRAVREVIKMEGGQVAVSGAKVLASVPLPIGGIVADVTPEAMSRMEAKLDKATTKLGCRLRSPFMSMMFLSITATPEYALTDQGLVDTTSLKVVDPVLGPG